MHAETALIDAAAEQIIKGLEIPPCPTILTSILREMREDEPDYRRIGGMIEGDVGLAAATLKIANSPLFGRRSKVTSVQRALAVLGLKNVAQVVTGLLLKQAFSVGQGAAMERFWNTSRRTAAIAARLAWEVGIERYEAYTFGLFRDAGMAVLMRRFPNHATAIAPAGVHGGPDVLAIEVSQFGVEHAIVGCKLALGWGLAATMCTAIRHHHTPAAWSSIAPDAARLAALGLVVDMIDSVTGGPKCGGWGAGGDIALAQLEVTSDVLPEWADIIEEADLES